jgi:hypothetical protein
LAYSASRSPGYTNAATIGYVEPVDEVVQHRAGRRVPEVVAAVVDESNG